MANSTLITDYLGKGTSAARPTSPPIASGALALYFATDTRQLSEWDGAAWNDVGVVSLASGHLLANATGSSAPPTDTSLTAFLDFVLGSARGSLARRGASGWTSLGPGAAGAALLTGGSGADPSWVALSGSNVAGVELLSHKGAASGYASLDGSGKVPSAQLPSGITGGLIFSGGWDAAANDLLLTDAPAAQGTFYVVTTAGTTPINTRTGSVSQWNLGDVIFSDGTYWDKLDGQSSEVVTVAGRTGAVTLTHADITDWAASIGWTATRVTALGTGVSIASGTLSATGSGGSVTQVGMAAPAEFTVSGSPVNTAGTLSFVKATQSANAVWAGPTTGAAAAPAFRALVAADVPVMVGSGASHAAGAVPDPGSTAGTTRYLREDGTWSTVAGAAGGTVTQIIAGSGLSGGTITASGTVALAAITAGSLLGNAGTVSAVPANIAIGAGLSISVAGTLAATGPTALSGDTDVAFASPASGDRIHFDGTHWVNGREPYVVAASIGTITGTVTGQVLFGHRFGAAVTFPANFGTTTAGAVSGADAFANATSACALTLGKCLAASDPTVGGNWTNVGTVTIAAAGHIGTLVSTGGSAIAFALGDKLRVIGNPDTTLANLNITLAGDR